MYLFIECVGDGHWSYFASSLSCLSALGAKNNPLFTHLSTESTLSPPPASLTPQLKQIQAYTVLFLPGAWVVYWHPSAGLVQHMFILSSNCKSWDSLVHSKADICINMMCAMAGLGFYWFVPVHFLCDLMIRSKILSKANHLLDCTAQVIKGHS